jgi:outer membrane protein W
MEPPFRLNRDPAFSPFIGDCVQLEPQGARNYPQCPVDIGRVEVLPVLRQLFYIRPEPINPFNMNMKVLMSAMLVGASTVAMAQKPSESNPSSLEVQLNLTSGSTVVSPTLKYRYFIADNLAVRFGVGFNSTTEENNYAENPDGTGAVGTQEIKTNEWSVAPGIEYHFAGTDRLSPYLGLAVSIGGGKYSEEWTNSDGDSYVNNLNATVDLPFSTFGVSLLAGVDYYFAENFFAGVELGWGTSSVTDKAGEISISSGGNTSKITTLEQKSGGSGFGAVGGVRIGWRF